MSGEGKKETSLKDALSLESLQERIDVMGRTIFGDSNYGKLMHGALSAQTTMQKTFAEQMAKGLHFYNMPSQDDLSSIADQCNRMEERMVRIETMLKALLEQSGAPSMASTAPVPRTRKPKAASSTGKRAAPAKKTQTKQ